MFKVNSDFGILAENDGRRLKVSGVSGPDVLVLQVRRVRNRALFTTVIELLGRHHGTGFEITKPRASLTYTLRLEGPREDVFLNELRDIAGPAGWRFVA